jgi:hypothetical protein
MNADMTDGQPIESRGEFLQAVRSLLSGLADSGAHEVTLVDVDFADWPLGEPDVVAGLTRWARLPMRKLRMIGLRFDDLARRQPRFAQWRREWAHLMQCASPVEVDASDLPCLLVCTSWVLELVDRDRWRGALVRDPRAVRPALERIDAILQRSEHAWPADVLGL